jgi:hypothetical protein
MDSSGSDYGVPTAVAGWHPAAEVFQKFMDRSKNFVTTCLNCVARQTRFRRTLRGNDSNRQARLRDPGGRTQRDAIAQVAYRWLR